MRKDGCEVVLVRLGGVVANLEDLAHEAFSVTAVDVNEEIERVGDVGLDSPVGEGDAALEREVLGAGERAASGVGVDGRGAAGVASGEGVEEGRALAASDLADDDAVGAVTEGGFQ